MAFNVHANADKKEEFNLIPKGYRLWVEINHRGMEVGKESGRRYADLELTVLPNQPFAGKKIWTIIGDPFDAQLAKDIAASAGDAKERLIANQKMALSALGRILEAAGKAKPEEPNSYNFASVDQQGRPMFYEIHQLRVPVLVGIREDKNNAYPPKNVVNSWLSPNKNRTDFKHYEAAMKGEFAPANAGPPIPQQPAQAGFGFGAQAPATPAGSPPQQGFGGFGQHQATPAIAPPAGPPPASPFGPGAAPGPWMQQGNQAPATAPAPAAPANPNVQGWPGQPGRAGSVGKFDDDIPF